MRVVCQEAQEGIIRNILMRHINSNPKMVIQGISIQGTDGDSEVVVKLTFSLGRAE